MRAYGTTTSCRNIKPLVIVSASAPTSYPIAAICRGTSQSTKAPPMTASAISSQTDPIRGDQDQPDADQREDGKLPEPRDPPDRLEFR